MDSNLEQFHEEEQPPLLIIDTSIQADIEDGNLSISAANELNNASFVSSHSNQTSGSSQNVCAFCGREHAEIKFF